jgi:uncharacterized protein YndB with AHSA1/START domain
MIMSDYQPLEISRTFDAPRQAVWDAWTQPEQFKQWFMPAPFTIPSCELDVRVGGNLRVDTQGPDGVIMPLVGKYTVVDEPSKLVLVSSPLDADGNKLFEVQQTVTLTETAGKTTLNITSEVLSAGENAEQYLSGMEQGLNQAFDQLSSLVASAS